MSKSQNNLVEWLFSQLWRTRKLCWTCDWIITLYFRIRGKYMSIAWLSYTSTLYDKPFYTDTKNSTTKINLFFILCFVFMGIALVRLWIFINILVIPEWIYLSHISNKISLQTTFGKWFYIVIMLCALEFIRVCDV